MAIALRRVRDRVNGRLNNHDGRKPSFDDVEVDQEIAAEAIGMGCLLPAAPSYTASAFTISAGVDTFTLPVIKAQYTANDGGAEYAGDVRISLVSDGSFLERVPREIIEDYKRGQVVLHVSRPRLFSLTEGDDQTINGLCYPGALVAEACNLYRTLMTDDVRDFIGAGTDDMDDVELKLSRLGALALELRVSVSLLLKMPPEDLAVRKLNPKVVDKWMHDADVYLYQDAARQHNIKDAGRFMRLVP